MGGAQLAVPLHALLSRPTAPSRSPSSRKLHQQSDRYQRMHLTFARGELRTRKAHRAIAAAAKRRDARLAARLMSRPYPRRGPRHRGRDRLLSRARPRTPSSPELGRASVTPAHRSPDRPRHAGTPLTHAIPPPARPPRRRPRLVRAGAGRPARHREAVRLREEGAAAPAHAHDRHRHRRGLVDVGRRVARRPHGRLRPARRPLHRADRRRRQRRR